MGFSDKAVHGSDKCILNDSAKSIRDSKALCV